MSDHLPEASSSFRSSLTMADAWARRSRMAFTWPGKKFDMGSPTCEGGIYIYIHAHIMCVIFIHKYIKSHILVSVRVRVVTYATTYNLTPPHGTQLTPPPKELVPWPNHHGTLTPIHICAHCFHEIPRNYYADCNALCSFSYLS